MAITVDSLKANYLDVLKNKYVSFQGRASRAEFWQFMLVNVVVSIVLAIIDSVIGFQILGSIYSLAVLLPGLGLGIRRLHDTDRSGWWLLISLVPLVGIIVLIVFWAQEAKPGANRFGA